MSKDETKTLLMVPSKRPSLSRRDVMLGAAGLTFAFAIGAYDDGRAEAESLNRSERSSAPG